MKRNVAYFVFLSAGVHVNQVHQPYYDPENKFTNFDDIYLYIFSKNFAATRMKFIFVTRCAGNKAFFWPHIKFEDFSNPKFLKMSGMSGYTRQIIFIIKNYILPKMA